MKNKIKIFGTPWHIAHNHDIMMALSDIADFYLLINYTRRWDTKLRPLPENAQWVTHFEKGKYDLAILHVDQQCSNMDLNKAVLTKHMKQAIKEVEPELPIVFINHGTPVYPEMYNDATKETGYKSEKLRKEIMDIIGEDHMVVNSHQASEDWGGGKTILHGMDASEWEYNEDIREPRVATFISQAGIGDKYYNRSYLVAVMDELDERYGIKLQWINTPRCFTAKSHEDYKRFLSKTLIYFNPTFASPMPRSRTEAMISGCCVVTTPQHGADDFIKDGENGFIVPHNNVQLTAKLIAKLMNEYPALAKEVGRQGRKTALEIFSRERYRRDWVEYLKEINVIK